MSKTEILKELPKLSSWEEVESRIRARLKK
jgi:hypothetical protein